MYRLVIRRGEAVEQSIDLGEGSWLVGRDPAAHVLLDDDTVSRRHLLLSHTGARLVVEDLRTTNGTRINGIERKTAILEVDDELVVGPWLLTIEGLEGAGVSPPAFSGAPPAGEETRRATQDDLTRD